MKCRWCCPHPQSLSSISFPSLLSVSNNACYYQVRMQIRAGVICPFFLLISLISSSVILYIFLSASPLSSNLAPTLCLSALFHSSSHPVTLSLCPRLFGLEQISRYMIVCVWNVDVCVCVCVCVCVRARWYR